MRSLVESLRRATFVLGLAALGCGGASHSNPPSSSSAPPAHRWLEFNMLAPRPVAASPDGRRVVVQAGCETILYDLTSDTRLQAWTGQAMAAHFSSDGSCLLIVRRGNDVVLWDVERCVPRRRFTGRAAAWREPGSYAHRTAAAVNHDATRVAIANCGKAFGRDLPQAILIYDVTTGQLQETMPLPGKAEVESIRFVPHRDRLLLSFRDWESARRDRQLELRDTHTGAVMAAFQPGDVARISPHGRWIAVGAALRGPPYSYSRSQNRSVDATRLTVWDAETGEAVRTFEHSGRPRGFAFDPTGERLLAALQMPTSGNGAPQPAGSLIEWEVATGSTVFARFPADKPYASVMYSPNGARRFATIEQPSGLDDDVDHLLRGWTVATGAELPIEEYRFASYNGEEELFFLPAGDRFIDFAADFKVRDTLSGKTAQTLPKYRAPATEAAFTPDGQQFLVGQSESFLTDLTSGEQRKWSLRGERHTFVDDGRTLFSADHSGVYLTDVAGGKVYWNLPLDIFYSDIDAAVSADAKRMVIAHRFNDEHASDVRLTLLETSRPDAPIILRRSVTAVALRPDGKRLLAATSEGIEEFAFESGESLGVLWSPPGRTLCLAYSADGTRVIAGGVTGHADWREPVTDDDCGWAMVGNAVTNQAVWLEGHTAPVTTAAFSPNASRCATGSYDTTVRLWNTEDGSGRHVFRGHLGTIHRVAFSPRGDAILSAAEDGAAIWNAVQFDQPLVGLADSFRVVKSINAFPPRTHVDPSAMRPDPSNGQAEWPVIEVGNVDRGDFPWDLRTWLSQAKVIRRVGGAPPTSAQPAMYGYDHCGSSRDGRRSVYVSKGDNKIVLVDEQGTIETSWEGRPFAAQVAISSSGDEVAIVRKFRSASDDRYEVHIFDSDSGRLLRVIDDIDTWYLVSIEIAPSEKTILLRFNNNSLDLRDYLTGKSLAEVKIPASGAGLQSAISPDGRYVATSKYPSANIYLHDPQTLDVVQTLPNPLPVRWFQFMPSGRRLLAGQPYTRDGRTLLTMWDVETQRELWSHAGPGGGQGEFSADGRLYLCQVRRDFWTLWDLKHGAVLCAVLTRNTSERNRPVLNPSGKALYRGSLDGPLLWKETSSETAEP